MQELRSPLSPKAREAHQPKRTIHSWPPPAPVGTRRTRIVCTLGPVSSSEDTINRLVDAGMDIARLNYSHGGFEDKEKMIAHLRAAEERCGNPLGILADLPGPKLRLGIFPGSISLKVGDEVDLVTGKANFESSEMKTADGRPRLPVPYEGLSADLDVGHKVLLADGVVSMTVSECPRKAGGVVRCKVEMAGEVSARKGINVPSSVVSLPAVTETDLKALRHALDHGVDFVAISYVRVKEDLIPAREELRKRNVDIPLIAKIEHPSGLKHLGDILDEVDGVMVARGDLGVEIPMEMVPLAQEEIISMALGRGLPVVVATQVLETMEHSPTPTRAELTDISTAIRQGASALMLSNETAVGQFPVQAVEAMARVARQIDGHPLLGRIHPTRSKVTSNQALGHAAITVAHDLEVDRILLATHHNPTVSMIASYHPKPVITVVTDSLAMARRVRLFRGVDTLLLPKESLSENQTKADAYPIMSTAMKLLLTDGRLRAGQKVVCLFGYPDAISSGVATIHLFVLDDKGNVSNIPAEAGRV